MEILARILESPKKPTQTRAEQQILNRLLK
jgi:hypothetical protein